MPSVEEHLARAKQNEAFVAYLAGSEYQEWRATGAFYAALHYLDAFLAIRGVHPPHHRARDSYIAADVHLREIYRVYRRLKRDSEDARYRTAVVGAEDVTARILPALRRIKAHLRPPVPGI